MSDSPSSTSQIAGITNMHWPAFLWCLEIEELKASCFPCGFKQITFGFVLHFHILKRKETCV